MKTRIRIWSAVLCAVLALSLTFNSLPVSATEYETEVSLPKLTDIILTKQGVVANTNTLDNISNALVDKIQNEVERVYNGMVEAGETTWDNVSNYIGECIEDYRIEKPLEAFFNSVSKYGFALPLVTAYDVASSLSPNEHGGAGRRRGDTYTIDDEVVDSVMDTFDTYIYANGSYVSVKSIPYSYLCDTAFWNDLNYYNNYCSFVESASNDNIYTFYLNATDNKISSITMCLISGGNLVLDALNNTYITYKVYQSNWSAGYLRQYNYDPFYMDNENDLTSPSSYDGGWFYVKDINVFKGYNLFTKDGRTIKIWRTLDDFKSQTVGQYSYYFSTNYYDYSVDNDNSITYSGDYYCDNSSTYSYSIVQETINNSTEITDSIVDSIVDESTTTIINNYYYTSDSGDGSGGDGSDSDGSDSDGSDSDGSGGDSDSSNPFDGVFEKLMDALGNVVGLLDDIVALVLSFVGDALNAIVGMFTSVINLLTAFKDELSGLSGALGEFFPYLPEDFWTIIMASISVICGLAIIRYFMNK